MKPILYESTETLFQSNGLGVLADCISAHVLEERNGQYEAEFEYPVDGIHYSDILEGRIILISHDESGDLQPFDIYGHSKTINGVTTFYAHHIAYRQNGITVKPFTATSLSQTLTKIKSNSVNTNPFNYSTDKSVSASFQLTSPKPLRSILGGEEGSLLDVYGTGEYEWDRFQVILHLHRGTDSGVVVRYGKNLISLQDDIDYSDSYNGIVPFWYGQNEPADGEEAVETLVTLSEWVVYKTGSTYDGRNTVIPVDFSAQFQTIPTEAQLRTAAQSYLDRGNPLLPKDTLTFDFVELSKTEEYSYLALQQVNLCDTVTVVYDDINTAMKVISVDWDVLNERYRSLTLGDAPATYAQVITDRLATIAENANEGAKLAKLWATNALSIAGNTDQYFWFTGTGTDTGAHITEVPKNTFLADPTHGGGNLIARSNGIAARNGLTELATFGANGSQIGVSTGRHVDITANGIDFMSGATSLAYITSTYARLGESGGTRVQLQNDTYHGLEVFDENNTSVAWLGASARIGASDSGHITLNPGGMEVWKKESNDTEPVRVAYFGGNVRIGASTGKNIYITSGSVNFMEDGTDFGAISTTGARFGQTNSNRFLINASSLQAYSTSNALYFEVSASGIKYGNNIKVASEGYADQAEADAISTASAYATAKANAAEENASRVATNFLSFSSSNGVDVGYTVSGSELSSKVNIKGDGIRLYDGAGNNCAFFGVDSNNPSVRIGKTDQRGHMRITPASGVRFLREDDSTPMAQIASDGLQIWSNDGTTNTSSAFFGAECRVGAAADKNIYIGNGSINFRDNGTNIGYLSGSASRIGALTEDHINIGSGGMEVFKYASGVSTSLAWFGDSARIGIATDGHVRLSSTGLNIKKGDVSLAWFGSSVRIGEQGESTFIVSGKKTYFTVDGDKTYLDLDGENGISRLGNTQYAFIRVAQSEISLRSGDYADIPLRAYTHDVNTSVTKTQTNTIDSDDTAKAMKIYASGYVYKIDDDIDTLTSVYVLIQNRYGEESGYITSGCSVMTMGDGGKYIKIASGQSVFNVGDIDAATTITITTTYTTAVSGISTAVSMANSNFYVNWSGDVHAAGYIYAEGHSSPIGAYDAKEDTTLMGSSTSYSEITASRISLNPGRYILTATASFAGNATGYRGVAFYRNGSAMTEGSELRQANPSSSWATRMTVSVFANVTSAETISIAVQQNSGGSLNVTWYFKAIRIR